MVSLARPIRAEIGEEIVEIDGRRFAILQELVGSRWYFLPLNPHDPLVMDNIRVRLGQRPHKWKHLAVNALKGYLSRWAATSLI